MFDLIEQATTQPTSADYAMGYAGGFNDACKPAPDKGVREMDKIKEVQSLLTEITQESKRNKRDADFYLRVLIQAILTHGVGGVLSIDPSQGFKAQELMSNAIEFGGNAVRVIRKEQE